MPRLTESTTAAAERVRGPDEIYGPYSYAIEPIHVLGRFEPVEITGYPGVPPLREEYRRTMVPGPRMIIDPNGFDPAFGQDLSWYESLHPINNTSIVDHMREMISIINGFQNSGF